MTAEEAKKIIDELTNEQASEVQNLKEAFTLGNEQSADFNIYHVNAALSYLHKYYSSNGTNTGSTSRVFLDPNDISNVLTNFLYASAFNMLHTVDDIRNLLNQIYLTTMSAILFFKWRTRFDGASISDTDEIVVNSNMFYNSTTIQINGLTESDSACTVTMYIDLEHDGWCIGHLLFTMELPLSIAAVDLDDILMSIEIQDAARKVIKKTNAKFTDLSMQLFRKYNLKVQDFMFS